MTKKARRIGTHAWFVREGTAYTIPTAGTVSKTGKPGAADTVWASSKLPIVKSLEIDPGNQTPDEITEPSPGLLQRVEVIEPGALPVLNFTFKEVNAFALELLFNTLALNDASTQFNPGERADTVRGWIKVQTYDQTNSPVTTLDLYCALRVKGPVTLDPTQLTEWQMEARPLFANDNTGSL